MGTIAFHRMVPGSAWRQLRGAFVLAAMSVVPSWGATALDTIASRMRDSLCAKGAPYHTASYLAQQKPDGTWPDVDYRDSTASTWTPVLHVQRTQAMAIAWVAPGSPYAGVDSVRRRIGLAMESYLVLDPRSTNFWYNEIGEALPWGQILVLLRGRVPDTTLSRWALRIRGPWSSYTGANLAWEGTAHIYRSIAVGRQEGIDSVLRAIERAIDPVYTGDGIHLDWSFSQHAGRRSYMYNGGYAQNFLDQVLPLWTFSQGTSLAFDPRRTAILDSLIVSGSAWMIHRNRWDPTSIGRTLARNFLPLATSLGISAASLHQAGGGASLDLVRRWLGDSVPWFQGADKAFWDCGYLAHHGPGWMTSIRAPRSDENATESGNGENLKGWFLGYGSHWVRVRGDEFDRIWPVFDWASVPGVTNDRVDTFPTGTNRWGFGYNYGSTSFVGGLSDGAASVFAYDYDVSGIKAKKAWFQTPDALVGLGAGMSAPSRGRPISTSVDQRWARGGVVWADRAGTVARLVGDSLASKSIGWVHHDSVGYWFPKPESLQVKSSPRSGNWKDINSGEKDSAVVGSVFALRLEHGQAISDPGFSYVVVPGVSADSMSRWVRSTSLSVVANGGNVQAVQEGGWRGMVFHSALDTVVFPDGLRVAVDRPCALIASRTEGGILWSAAAPDRSTGMLHVSFRTGSGWKNVGMDLPGPPFQGAGVRLFVPDTPGGCISPDNMPVFSWSGRNLVVEAAQGGQEARLVGADGRTVRSWPRLVAGTVVPVSGSVRWMLLAGSGGCRVVVPLPVGP